MDNPEILSTLDTEDTGRRQTKHKNTTQRRTVNRRATQTPLKPGWISVLAKGKQLMPLVRHPQCYLYIQYVFDINKYQNKVVYDFWSLFGFHGNKFKLLWKESVYNDGHQFQ